MDQKLAKKLIGYVSDMHERSEEYGIDEVLVYDEVKDEEDIGRIYDEVVGKTICTQCEKRKLFDEKNAEFYCPVHE